MDLASLQTTVARISARLNENLSETARDLGLQGLDPASLAGVGAAGRYLEDGTVVSQDGIRETKKLLESRREASMAEGLRRVLAMMLRGLPVVTFFPQVVQCLSSSTSSNTTSSASAIQIRSLVSLYILRQAAFEPDLALLAVNMYQKDLRDPNPVIRALAIRTLAGMELDSIVTLVLMSLKTASRDTNWFVRRTVAEALERVYVLDPSHLTSLIPILETGLADQNPLVTGSSLAAFESICPDRTDLLHPHYRRYCKSLVDADEWTQVILLRVLEQYARQQFPDPEITKRLDPDLQLLLQCTEPLLWNRNPAVVLSVVRVTYRLSPSSFSRKHAAALARLLQAPPEIQGTVLAAIATIASEKPSYFAQHLQYFYVYQLFDNPANKLLKLQILVLLADESNITTILGEFIAYTKLLDPAFRQQVVSSIGDCARKVPKVQSACLRTLTDLLDKYKEDEVTASLLHEISQILLVAGLSTQQVKKALAELLLRFSEDRFDSAISRAEFYKTISAASHLLGEMLPNALDVVRRGAKGFTHEVETGKISLLRLSSKLLVLSQQSASPALLKTASTIHIYLLTLGKYDPSWSVRASTRMYTGLANIVKPPSPSDKEDEAQQLEQDAFASGEAISIAPPRLVDADLEESKLVPAVQAAILGGDRPTASAINEVKSAANLEQLAGWQKLPEWLEQPPQHKLRDTEVEASTSSAKAYRGFGNTPTSSSSPSRKAANHMQASRGSSKRRSEKVVLVPTESYTPPAPERPRATNLQAFLESSEEDAEDETETESESETDSDEAAATGDVQPQQQEDEETDSQEESSSGLEDSEDEQDAGAPLVALDGR